jgi:hypothetical protein
MALGVGRACPLCPGSSDVDLLRDGEGVVDLDPKVSDCAFDLRMAKQELNRAQIARPAVYQRRLGATERECVPNSRGSRPIPAIQLETRREYCRVDMQ